MNETPHTLGQGRLPEDVTSFVGRGQATTQVRHLLSESRLVTLTGVGGVGKSRLALRVARDLSRTFPDGAWLVELARLEDPALVGSAVTTALGLPNSTARDPAEGLIDYLTDKRLLLVLDNCEHLLAACARLVATVLPAVPGLRVLVTSRAPLGVNGEHIWQVPPLSVPGSDVAPDDIRQYEALTLFEARAAAVRPGFRIDATNRLAVTRLCRRLDGLPLAIELAAAVWLRTLSVEEILLRLRDRFRMPAAEEAMLDRHRTLRASVEWSFDLCSELERTLWAMLSVFAGEFDLDAAYAVCGHDGLEVLAGITGLVDKSILIRGDEGTTARYRMLDTIRHYGAERLATTGERPGLRRRHRDHYLHVAERAEAESCGPQLAEWTARLRAERANLWAALDYCLTVPGESRAGLAMGAALWPYWVACGFVRDGRYWLDRLLALDAEPGHERARALWVDGWIAFLQGDSSASLRLLEESRELTRRLGDEREATHALQHLGSTLLALKADAVPVLDEALAWHRRSGWTALGLLCLVQRAEAAIVAGDIDLAQVLLNECVAAGETLGELFARSWAEWDLGVTWWLVGDLDSALAHLGEAVRWMLHVGDQLGFPFCVEVLGWVAVSAGDARRAAVLFGAADRGWALIGLPLFHIETLLAWREECRRRCREEIGERAYEAARQKAMRLTPEEVAATGLGGAAEPDAAPAAERVLTARETEIATMIAQGMSNKDVAAALVIAPRTVEGHVEHILRKLGVGTRAQIAAWITEHPEG